MFQINPLSSTPVYVQIEDQVKKFISVGIFKPGDPLPSVRSLSLDLGANANTIQRAFNELNNLGLIVSVPGKGIYVSPNAEEIMLGESRKRLVSLTDTVKDLSVAGLTDEEILDAVKAGLKNKIKKQESEV